MAQPMILPNKPQILYEQNLLQFPSHQNKLCHPTTTATATTTTPTPIQRLLFQDHLRKLASISWTICKQSASFVILTDKQK